MRKTICHVGVDAAAVDRVIDLAIISGIPAIEKRACC